MRSWLISIITCCVFLAPLRPAFADDSWMDPDVASEFSGKKIVDIQVQGNLRVEKAAILNIIVSRKGQRLEPAKIRADIRALWRVKHFSNVAVSAENVSGGVLLVYSVAEKRSIRKVYVSGNDGVGLDDINGKLELTLGVALDPALVKADAERIRKLYSEKGYYLAKVESRTDDAEEGEVDVFFDIEEGPKVEVRGVRFVGNEAVPDEVLKGSIATREKGVLSFLDSSGKFNEEELSRDLSRLQAIYFDRGHITVNIGTPKLELSGDRNYLYVSVPISEGPVYSISETTFKGDLEGKEEAHKKRLAVEPGETFSRTKVGLGVERVTNFYRDRGYANAKVQMRHESDEAARTVSLNFSVEKGEKVYIERINVYNNTKTRDKVIRREMKIGEGDLYNQTDIEISRRRVMSLGFFERVDITPVKGSSPEFMVLNIEVTERPTGTFQIGAGFSSVESFIAQAQITQQNFLGRGQTVALQAQLSSLRQLVLFRFWEPWFLDTRVNFGLNLYNQSQGFGTFTRDSLGGTMTWGYPLSWESRIAATYKLEEVGVSTGAGGFSTFGGVRVPLSSSVANLFRGGTTSSLKLQLVYDSRNDRVIRPTKGWYNSVFVEVADEATLSENVFFRYGGFVRHYKPLVGPFILKLNGEVGVTTSRDPLGVPIIERYLLGGIFDIRGFAPRSLGPVLNVSQPGQVGEPLGQLPLGGNLQVIGNAEIEFPIFSEVQIYGVVFADVGNAYNLEDRYCSGSIGGEAVSKKVDPCFSFPGSFTQGLRYSTGFGIRWISPIGPLRFEWGIPLDRQQNEDPVVFEFTIGNFF